MILLLILLLLLSPRVILFFEWLFNSARFHLVFPNFFLPLLGFIFLPWTTLAYFFSYVPTLGYLTGWGWLWVILGFLADLASYGSTRYSRRGY